MAVTKNPATRAVPTTTVATIKQTLDGQAEKLRFFPDSFA